MIVTTQKPLDEVLSFISPYSDILITGCDGCTQPPRGLREAKTILGPQMEGVAVVLSLACGIGVQTLAGIFPEIPVFPAQNTHFMGAEERESGILEERCAGCGDCLLAETGGICPVARCSKGLLSGACGGSKDGKCELSSDRDCAWCLIYERLKEQGKLALLKKSRPPRDYQLSGWRVTT
jgi:hypothetical protein